MRVPVNDDEGDPMRVGNLSSIRPFYLKLFLGKINEVSQDEEQEEEEEEDEGGDGGGGAEG